MQYLLYTYVLEYDEVHNQPQPWSCKYCTFRGGLYTGKCCRTATLGCSEISPASYKDEGVRHENNKLPAELDVTNGRVRKTTSRSKEIIY